MPSIGASWRAVRDRFRAAGIDTPELDARLLAEAAFGRDPLGLLARENEPAEATSLARLEAFAGRRLAGEPVARILGHREFYGLDFRLGAETLVPRPETELVVDLAREALTDTERPVVLDLGTGSGAIAIALLVARPDARAVATDISEAALAVARANAEAHGVADRLDLRGGSWWAPVGRDERFGAVLSNPPYVESATIAGLAPEVREFDPYAALDGGPDGLEAYRAIFAEAARHLVPGAPLVVEIGAGQGPQLVALARQAGFGRAVVKKDLAGLDRAILAHHK